MARAIGIDLGTTNSVVAFLENDKPEVIVNAEGAKTTPSIVHYSSENSEIIVGEMAKRQLVTHPERTVRSVKRFMGKRYSEAEDLLQDINYRVIPNNAGEIMISFGDEHYSPEDISADILEKMKQTAEEFLGEEIGHAVITVPAYFNDSQRQSTKKAGQEAGLQVLRIINEPTAAALSFGIKNDEEEKVVVFDFGGGTFDVTVLEMHGDVLEVLSTNGDCSLGGDNIDRLVYEYLVQEINNQTGVNPEVDISACQRIQEAAEQAKCELSSMQKTTIHLPFIVADDEGPKHFTGELTREQFETMLQPILDRLLLPCKNAMNDASLIQNDIDHVLLVGGSTRIPAVQTLVKQYFQQEPNRSVNPDETVAMGAAIQAGIITGSLDEVLLLDITPLSLGIELAGGVYSVLIPRNSSIPAKIEKKFTTVIDNQKTVNVHVLQGERKIANENRTLAHFKLNGISSAPREVPEIEVRFQIDANGILNVTATDVTSGTSKDMTITSSFAASEEEVEQVIRSAEESIEEDLDYLKVQRRIEQAKHFSEMVRTFIEQFSTGMTEEEHKMFHEKMFRLDINIQKRNLDAIADAEGELMALGERYKDIFYAHKTSYDA